MSRELARTLFEEGVRQAEAGNLHAAVRALEGALAADPDHLDASARLARCHERAGHRSRAIEAWRNAARIAPRDADVALGLAEALRVAGCPHASIAAYDAVLAVRPGDTFALAGRAESLRLVGQPAEALVFYDRALTADPRHLFAIRGRAAALNALHRWADALPLWLFALAIDGTNAFAITGRAEAEHGLRAGPDAPPPEPEPLPTGPRLLAEEDRAWARALANDFRWDEAVAALERAVARFVDAPRGDAPTEGAEIPGAEPREWRLELANAYEALRRTEDAIASWGRALDLGAPPAATFAKMADAWRRAGRSEEAVLCADASVAASPTVGALVARADALRVLGRHPEAVETWEQAVALAPQDPVALRGRALAWEKVGRPAEAARAWQALLDVAPESAEAKAGVETNQSRAQAADPLPALPDRDEVGPEATVGRRAAHELLVTARAAIARVQWPIATDAAVAATERDPDWAHAWFVSGIAFEGARQYARAIRAYDECLAREPLHVGASCRRADALRRKGDHFDALTAFDAVLWAHPEEVRALVGRAETLRILGKYADAVRWYDRALTVRDDLLPALYGKAAAMVGLRRLDEAVAMWRRAADLDPASPAARRGLAHAELLQRQENERRPPGDKAAAPAASPATAPPAAAKDAPRSGNPHLRARDEYDRGRSFHKDKDYASAIAAFQRAIDLDATFVDAHYRLGVAFEDDRQFRRAIETYERVLSLKPDHVQAATNIGECHRKNEKYKEAVRAYERALKVRADYLYALAGRGESMRMLGDYEGSLVWFDKALAVGPRHAFAIQGKAAALNALRRFKEALPLWEKALEIDARSQFALDGKAFCESQIKASAAEPAEDGEPSGTPTLDEQGRDLTALAREGRLGEVIGRETEIRTVLKTLMRRQKANPLLLGDPGVGKTAIVEGVARALAGPECPERLRNMRVIELSMGSLVAGTKYRGTFEERLKSIIKEAKSQPGIVLFIDEIHTLVGAGRTEGGSLDAANILKPALARGEITVIGATTVAEYRKHFESDSALERRFQPIQVEEPSFDDTVQLLARVQGQYVRHHRVEIDPDVLPACVRLAVRFVPDRRLPDKALDLLDEACAEASLSGADRVTPPMVAQVLSERTGIPIRDLTTAERERLSQIEHWLERRVIGQHDAVHQIANTVRLSRAGLRDAKRPRGVFLFAGGSGVGKTELAKALADFLFPEGNAFIRLDMSEYSEKFTGSRLLGAPPGYAGHGEEGQLSGPLRRRPYAVVLLDEFEKAHPDVQTTFLSLFDEGVITDSEGRRVEAREAFFIITTNAGSDLARQSRLGFGGASAAEQREIVVERVKRQFRPELINRIDEIVWFRPLDDIDLEQIVLLNLGRLAERAAIEGVSLSWDQDVIARCARFKADPQFGARPALRAIDELVAEPLGVLMLRDEKRPGRHFHAVADGEDITFETRQTPQPPEGVPVET